MPSALKWRFQCSIVCVCAARTAFDHDTHCTNYLVKYTRQLATVRVVFKDEEEENACLWAWCVWAHGCAVSVLYAHVGAVNAQMWLPSMCAYIHILLDSVQYTTK